MMGDATVNNLESQQDASDEAIQASAESLRAAVRVLRRDRERERARRSREGEQQVESSEGADRGGCETAGGKQPRAGQGQENDDMGPVTESDVKELVRMARAHREALEEAQRMHRDPPDVPRVLAPLLFPDQEATEHGDSSSPVSARSLLRRIRAAWDGIQAGLVVPAKKAAGELAASADRAIVRTVRKVRGAEFDDWDDDVDRGGAIEAGSGSSSPSRVVNGRKAGWLEPIPLVHGDSRITQQLSRVGKPDAEQGHRSDGMAGRGRPQPIEDMARLSVLELQAAPLSYRADNDRAVGGSIRVEPAAVVGPEVLAARAALLPEARCAVPPARLQVQRGIEDDPLSRAVQAQLVQAGAAAATRSRAGAASSGPAPVADNVELEVRRLDRDWDRACAHVADVTAAELRPDAVFGPARDAGTRPVYPLVSQRPSLDDANTGRKSKLIAQADAVLMPSVLTEETAACLEASNLAHGTESQALTREPSGSLEGTARSSSLRAGASVDAIRRRHRAHGRATGAITADDWLQQDDAEDPLLEKLVVSSAARTGRPGASLLSRDGELVGLVTAGAGRARVAVSLMPGSRGRAALERMLVQVRKSSGVAGGESLASPRQDQEGGGLGVIQAGWMGLTHGEGDKERETEAVRILQLERRGAGHGAGLRAGDAILRAQGRPLRSVRAFRAAEAAFCSKGSGSGIISLSVRRAVGDGDEETVLVRCSGRV